MKQRDYTIGRDGKRINVDPQAAKEQREAMRKLELEEYVVQIPSSLGSGQFHDQIQIMAEVMLTLYEETQQLIAASGAMIDDILEGFISVDAEGFGGGGSGGGQLPELSISATTASGGNFGGDGSTGGRF